MDMDIWASIARIFAIFAGVIFGSAAISSACWVWLRKQIFAYGGSALCGSGVILLGLSIWHSVEFGISGTSLTLKMQAELEQRLRLLNDDPKKILFALQSIDETGLDKGLVDPVLMIAKDAFRRPEVATQARDLLNKWIPPEQLMEILGTTSDPNIKAAASEVLVQSSEPDKIQQIAQSAASPAIKDAAKSLLDAKWVV